ncbi:uncharacterized protein LOC135475606 [Liolophura sinensis]|uniref:uncharacterized protein LOC135475606 n=1 Tax=Liolophura sinensis TaxID=3198878 RepID=UPI00315987C2
MEVNTEKEHAQRSRSTPPYARGKSGAGKLTVVVILPSESVCTIRSVPLSVTVNWVFCHLELLSGIASDICTLHYPDGSDVRKNENLILTQKCEKTVVLRLQLRDGYHGLCKSVTNDNWSDLEEVLIDSVRQDAESNSDGLEQDGWSSDKWFYSLFLASSLDRDKLCRRILTKNDIVNRVTKFGHTALHAAVCRDRVAVVDILLQHKVNLTMSNALGQTPLHTAISRSSKRCAKKLRYVLFHERSTELCTSPDSSPPQPSREPTPAMPRSRAQMLFRKYGIKETIPKPWHPSQNAAPKSNPQSRDKQDIRQGLSISLQDTNENSTVSSHSAQPQNNVETRRASSAKLPVTQKVLRMPSRGRSAEPEKSSYWAKIPKARILLQLSGRANPSLVGFKGSSDSAAFESKLNVVDFRLANQSKKVPGCHAPHPSPESLSPPDHLEFREGSKATDGSPEEKNGERQLGVEESEKPGKYDRQQSSSSIRSRAEGDRMSPKPPNRVKWLSIKRKLRLAYLQSRAQRTKTGLNEAAFKAWMERKAKETRSSKVSHTEECETDSENENSGDKAFQKWLHDKKHAPENHRIFRGRYNSVFHTGSTMVGEAKHPDSKEYKDAHKNWLKSREGWQLDLPSGVSRTEFKQSKAYKCMEAQRRRMRTSAVTYEEWMDAKYVRSRFLKELESLDTAERKQEMNSML